MNPVLGMAIGQGVNALANIFGANSAADAQEAASKRTQRTALQNFLTQLTLAEPARGVGYQALQDMAGLYGYSTPAYPTFNSVAAMATPLGSKSIAKGLKRGLTVDQLSSMGTLGQINAKSMRRLVKAGLTPEDIAQLQGRQPAGGMDAQQSAQQPAQQSLMDRITQMPGYQFGMQEGSNALQQSAANRGGLFSGDTGKDLFQWGRDYSASKFGEDWNRLAQLAGYGAQGTQQAAGAANTATGAMMGAQQDIGNARASGVLGTTNAIGNAVNSGINNYLMWQLMNKQPGNPTPPYSPYGPYSGGYSFPGGR